MSTPLNTDDSAIRLEYPWLGTPDVPAPIRARLLTWVRLVVTIMGIAPLLWLALPMPLFQFAPIDATLAKGLTVGVVGVGLGTLITWRTSRHITPTTPIGYWLHTFKGELDAPTDAVPEVTRKVEFSMQVWGEDDERLATPHKITVPPQFREEN